MIISDDTLCNRESFYQVLEDLRQEACGWGKSDRDKSLKSRYWKAPQSAYLKLQVHWDYRPIASRLNWEATSDYLSASSLYECESQRLFDLLSHNHNLRFDRIFEQASENIFLRVISHWEVGTKLTPPVLKLRDDGKLGKIDGFHRLAVAFAAKVSHIPFWAVFPDGFTDVRQISPASGCMQPNNGEEKHQSQ